MDDFCGCEHDEFESIVQAWSHGREDAERDAWERMRLQTAITIQPHLKKKITPKQLITLPWDRKIHKKQIYMLSGEERRKRFEELKTKI